MESFQIGGRWFKPNYHTHIVFDWMDHDTYKDFIDNPHSSPVNPKIADVFFKSSLMELWGRGIAYIFDECENMVC